MKKLIQQLGAGLFVLMVAQSLGNAGYAQSQDDPAQMLKHFDAVVFGSEYEGADAATQIQKWMTPIRISVSELDGQMLEQPGGKRELKLSNVRPTPDKVAMIRTHLTTLVGLTQVANEKSDREAGKAANFLIKFVPRLAMGQGFLAPDVEPDLLSQLARPGVCYFVTRSIRTGAMFRALIIVNRELPPEQMNACLLEEMTQALGLPNDSDIVQPSVFNQQSVRQALTETDEIVLKTLYDNRLPAGTPRRDALRIADEILREHLGN